MGGILDVPGAVAAATELRQRIGLAPDQPLPCVLRLAEEELGVQVVVTRELPEGASGFYLPRAGAPPVIAVTGAHHVVRQRFTVAHEVGHHVLGHGAAPRVVLVADPGAGSAGAATHREVRPEHGSPGPDDPAPLHRDASMATEPPGAPGAAGGPDASGVTGVTAEVVVPYRPRRSTDPRERAANAFAAELLCPADGARALVTAHAEEDDDGRPIIDFDLVVRISAVFGLSAHSVLARLETAGILTDPLPRAALQARVDQGEHVPRYAALGLGAVDDELEAIHRSGLLPRLPEGVDGDLLLSVTAPEQPIGDVPAPIRELRRLLGLPA